MKQLLPLYLIVLCFSTHAAPWIQKANFGGVGRHRAIGMAIGNKGFIGLGHVNGTGVDISYKDWWMFDPASNSWTQKANYPMNNHGAVGFGTSTRGYVGGGSALGPEFYQYNPVTNTWTSIAPCPFNPGDTQGFSVNEKGYVYWTNQLAEYDPSVNAWTLKATAPVSFGTWSCSFATNSSGFIKSGVNFYEFKPEQNTWIQRTNFPGVMSNGSSAFCINGKGYVTCGYVGALSNVTDEVWEFNPGQNAWSFVGAFPGTNRRFPVAFAVNNQGYFGTGTNGINLNDFWLFDLNLLEINKLDFSTTQIYPNPSNGQFIIQLPDNTSEYFPITFIVNDLQGRTIHKGTIEQSITHVQLSAIEKQGLYTISLFSDNKLVFREKITTY